MKQRATILDLIEAGLWGEQKQVRAYTDLLIQRIETEADTPQDERERDIAALRRLIERRDSGERGRVIYPAAATERTEIREDGNQGHQEQTSCAVDSLLQRLKELTAERKRVEKANDTFSQLFAPLMEQSEKTPTWEKHRQRVDALTAEISGFSVWWEPRHGVYALIPTMEKKALEEKSELHE